MKKWLEKIPSWMLSGICLVAILWLTLVPDPIGDIEPPLFPGVDKVVHAIMFGGLTFCLLLDRKRKTDWVPLKWWFIIGAAAVSALIGLIIEFMQGWMDVGRSYDILDFIADCAGAMLVALFCFKWWRWVFASLVLLIILIPVLIYLPPIQKWGVGLASAYLEKSTGMKARVGGINLKFPLDLNLKDVLVLDAVGDTMVSARNAIADVQLLPLLDLDVKINKLQLQEGYYRMVAADSSMVMTLRAGFLEVDGKSSANIAKSEINLNEATIRNGKVSLMMDVWKKKQEPNDTSTSTPFLITAKKLNLENFGFEMQMLPTIDHLKFDVRKLALSNGRIDLRSNIVTWDDVVASNGIGEFITPSEELLAKLPPVPESEPSDGPPMQILGKHISLTGFQARYGQAGAKPKAGFDPSYISFSGLNIDVKDFYNESSSVRLPFTKLEGKERSGLEVASGSGVFELDSVGIALKKMNIATLYSHIQGDATIPMALLSMSPDAKMDVAMSATIGLPDIESMLPDLKKYTRLLPNRNPVDAQIAASGSLKSILIQKLLLSIRDVVNIKGNGYARNPLNLKKMDAKVAFDGELANPRFVQQLTGMKDIRIPVFHIKGVATAMHENYAADFSLVTPAGSVAAKGGVGMNSERYNIAANLSNFNVATIMPSLGVGKISGSVKGEGVGFNPISGHSVTKVALDITSLEYRHRPYHNIRGVVELDRDGVLAVDAVSVNPGLDLSLAGSGIIKNDDYKIDMHANIRELDLQKIGLSETVNSGSGIISIKGDMQPARWLYDVDLAVSNLDWILPDRIIHLPNGVTAHLDASSSRTQAHIESNLTSMSFDGDSGLKALVDSAVKATSLIANQIKERNLDVPLLSAMFPKFRLNVEGSGRGLIGQILQGTDLAVDSVYGHLEKDSIITGSFMAREFSTKTLTLDTIGLRIGESRGLLDYKIHIGNQSGNLDEFAKVDLNGYLGRNRLGAFLTQRNISGATGYKIGLTAAMADSVISMHFTPLNATIAYLPWEMNDDNYIDYNVFNNRVNANLMAQSSESSILLKTQPTPSGFDELQVKLDNIYLEDFLKMSILAPPIGGKLSTDMHILYDGSELSGKGTLALKRLTYNRMRLGDFDADLVAGMKADGSSGITADLKVDGIKALRGYANLRKDSLNGLEPDSLGIKLTGFPLKVINPFLADNAKLSGRLTGDIHMGGSFKSPLLNGFLKFEDAEALVSISQTQLRIDSVPINIENGIIDFKKFQIFAFNSNPLIINGRVDASTLTSPSFNLALDGANCQLVKSDRRSKGDLFGKLFVDLGAKIRGNMRAMDITANLNILGTSDLTYRLNTAPSELTNESNNGVVKFVDFNDTTTVVQADSVESGMAMRISAGLNVASGTKVSVLLSPDGSDRVNLTPTAKLNFYQNYMGDMRLNGSLNLGEGFVRYAVEMIGEKMFTFSPGSSITWGGDIMNPSLNISAVNEVKANVAQGGNSSLVDFLITLKGGGTLKAPTVSFDLATTDNMTIQNELQAMSADQRQTQAMNLLLYGQYTGQNSRSQGGNLAGNMLYGFIESTLNSWAAKNIRGVDLTFGIDQYDQKVDGTGTLQTSYSYQVSKSMFNNRFKILVGGNYSTDSSPDENLSQNLISDISFEYIMRQSETLNMSARLFRHTGFESILEGEIVETGVGFVVKRKADSVLRLFTPHKKGRREPLDTIKKEDSAVQRKDSTKVGVNAEKGGEK